MRNAEMFVVVNLQVAGTHRWEECGLRDVMYLRNVHRHVFHIQAKKAVRDADREIEIITFKDEIRKYLRIKYGDPCAFDGMSCEMIAKELGDRFELSSCSVLEDGENGAEIIFK